MEASEPVRLVSTSREFEPSAYEANTVLEVHQHCQEEVGFRPWLTLAALVVVVRIFIIGAVVAVVVLGGLIV